ncbi:MAG TPA: LptA/OstA family protein, partial [Rhizomicrobium sp.]|nr:LptA/OstA family protein [Rhizomicrobium sp.]
MRTSLLLGAAIVLTAPALAQTSTRTSAQATTPTPGRTSSSKQPAATTGGQILLQADEVVYDDQAKTVSAVGHVEITQDERTLMADRVDYDRNADKVTARGNVVLMDQNGNVAFADHVVLTDHMRDGALSGFGALIGKNGRLAARDAQRVHGNTIIANYTVYSPCKICNQTGQRTPLWQVKAERVVYDQARHRVHFRNATIEVMGVPVLYTPVMNVPDPTVRHASGLLAPELGNSTKIGYFVRTPVYVSLSPSTDLTLAPLISTGGGDVLEAEYRARWNNGGMWLQGSGAYNPDGSLFGTPGVQTY